MSAADHLEAAVVIDSARDPVASGRFDQFIAEVGMDPVKLSQAGIARDAYRDYGKGSGHKASLNFGDCFAYALAKETKSGRTPTVSLSQRVSSLAVGSVFVGVVVAGAQQRSRTPRRRDLSGQMNMVLSTRSTLELRPHQHNDSG